MPSYLSVPSNAHLCLCLLSYLYSLAMLLPSSPLFSVFAFLLLLSRSSSSFSPSLQIMHEEFLEDINCLLNSGEIPELFTAEESDRITTDMRPVVEAAGIPPSRAECNAAFVQRVRDCLHVVLCMSPVGDALRCVRACACVCV